MKYKCQCGAPEFASIGIKQLLNGNYDNFGYWLNPESDLHFKVADRFCERCGAPLCEDCGVWKGTYNYTPLDKIGNFDLKKEYLCRTCAEWEEQCQS